LLRTTCDETDPHEVGEPSEAARNKLCHLYHGWKGDEDCEHLKNDRQEFSMVNPAISALCASYLPKRC
jgi:hypothetical protein